MYVYLNTQISDDEMIPIRAYCDNHKSEFAVMFGVNMDSFENKTQNPIG